MRVPLSWLQDFTPIDASPDIIADTLNSLGLVVEGIERIGEGLDGVVIGRVVDVRAHPNADRVRLADVDLGTGETTQIACGASNLEAGQKVAVATVGTTLPDGMKIDARKMRGEWSHGMICAEDELGLSTSRAGGIMVLDQDLEVGADFATAVGIVPDVVFDLEIETNRPDAMCVSGVARDLAAKLGLDFAIPQPEITEASTSTTDRVSVAVHDPKICPRFTARVITGVSIGPSPQWIQRRLQLAGMRPINNVVDASNYVMLELGQPSHPYDLAKLNGSQLQVRASRAGEKIETLDGNARALEAGTPVICSGNDSIVGVAGIMGAANSEISNDSTDIVIEAALFDSYAINLASRQLALRTDASARFERRIDRCGHDRAQKRLAQLVQLSCPQASIATGMIDVDHTPAWPSTQDRVAVRTERVNKILGTDLDRAQIDDALRRIGFGLEDTTVVVPSFRPDVEREIDVIEEVARIHGYDNIARRTPTAPVAARLTRHQFERRRIRNLLAGMGFNEAWTSSLIGPQDLAKCALDSNAISLTNPVVEEESLLRPSLMPGLVKAVAYNASRQNDVVRLFEIGNVFGAPGTDQLLPVESEMLALIEYSPDCDAKTMAGRWLSLSAALSITGLPVRPGQPKGLHPTRSAQLPDGAGLFGELDPEVTKAWGIDGRVAFGQFDLAALVRHIEAVPQMKPVSRFPSAEFDLALVVDDAEVASNVAASLTAAVGADLLETVKLFDVFRHESLGEGRRSLAFRIRIAATDRTLSEEDITAVRHRCLAAVETNHGASLRS